MSPYSTISSYFCDNCYITYVYKSDLLLLLIHIIVSRITALYFSDQNMVNYSVAKLTFCKYIHIKILRQMLPLTILI